MVESGRSDAADIHAWPLTDRLKPLENSDVFRSVVGWCHVYNSATDQMPRLATLLSLTIVAAFQLRLAAAGPVRNVRDGDGLVGVVVGEDVPVPGGTAAMALSLGIETVPERARFVAELSRLAHQARGRRNITRANAAAIPLREPAAQS